MRRETRDAGGNRGNGGKWIRTKKRHRIYARDGWRCVWCLANLCLPGEPGEPACLDHVLPRERGGSNHESNLVTSCMSCNAARGPRSAIEFAFQIDYTEHAADILDRVITAMGTPLP